MSEKNIYDKIREDVKADQKPTPDINERFGKPANENAFDRIRREADKRKAARDAEQQKNDEFFARMKTDNLII